MVDYIKKVYLKESQFSIKFTGDADQLIEQLQRHKKPNGGFKFEIKKRKAPDEYGNTHFIVVDDWMPQPKSDPREQDSQPNTDEIPF
jgi:glycerophosphoryl diester phosphodiesterase